MDGVVAALGGADRPRARRGRWGRGRACCSGPCGSFARSGGSAAGRATSNPMAATAGRRVAAVRERPGLPATRRAVASRPIGAREELVPGAVERSLALDAQGVARRSGSRGRVRACARAAPSPRPTSPRRAGPPPGASRRAAPRTTPRAGARARAPLTAAAARSNSSAPSSAHQLDVEAGRDLDLGVVQPGRRSGRSTPRRGRSRRPRAWASTSAPQRSVPGASRCIGVHGALARRPGRAARRWRRAASWPSRNTVALTGKVSPTTALAGHRPQATTGDTSRIGIRPVLTQSSSANLPPRGRLTTCRSDLARVSPPEM